MGQGPGMQGAASPGGSAFQASGGPTTGNYAMGGATPPIPTNLPMMGAMGSQPMQPGSMMTGGANAQMVQGPFQGQPGQPQPTAPPFPTNLPMMTGGGSTMAGLPPGAQMPSQLGNYGGPSLGVYGSGGQADTFGAVGNPAGMGPQQMTPQFQQFLQQHTQPRTGNPFQPQPFPQLQHGNPQMLRALGLG